jgi:type IV pilus assembly protein PilY1
MNCFAYRLQAHALAILMAMGFYAAPSTAQLTDIASKPLSSVNKTSVKPNILFVLDNSGSMGFDFMPDQTAGPQCRSSGATTTSTGGFTSNCCNGGSTGETCLTGTAPFGSRRMFPPLLASEFNSMAYNPALHYQPGVDASNKSSPEMSAAQTANWTSVQNNFYPSNPNTGSINLVTGFPDVAWCPTGFTAATPNSTCLRNGNYILPGRVGATNYTVFRATVSNGSASIVTGDPTNPVTSAATALGPHYYRIVPSEFCTDSSLRNCRHGSTSSHTVPAPVRWCRSGTIAQSSSPAVNDCQSTRTSAFPIARYPTKYVVAPVNSVPQFQGRFERIDIVPNTTYAKAATRTDCAGATCTYDEEMTNFANWWAYYRTRMQTMKSGVSRSFAVVDDTRRVGFATINLTNQAFVNISDFDVTQKQAWFSKMLGTIPSGGTPLRGALSRAGRLFGGKMSTFNGVSVVDPVQLSCQRNFTILSTDGFWNEAGNDNWFDLSGSTLVGDRDANLPVPKKDRAPTSNTLADVAAYYFNTDLRTGCGSKVCGTAGEADEVQSMRTLTLGLGASGVMQFDPSYLTAASGDFHAIKNEILANPASGICNWQASGACTWPVPKNNEESTIDDLWHAAVNGAPDKESFYFSATDPATLFSGMKAALATTDKVDRAAAAATTSNPNVTAGDNQVFISNFTSELWSGEVQSRRLDINTGVVDSNVEWSASALLDAKTQRTVVTFDPGASNKLRALEWANLDATEQAFFKAPAITAAGVGLSQFCTLGTACLSAGDQSTAQGKLLLDFVLGDRTHEGPDTDPKKFFRQRASRLGDIVSSEAVFVGQPTLSYPGPEYATYKSSTAGRPGMVYVGANDGMLHAFDAKTGEELWAYVPTAVLPNLYRLADKDYATKHAYFVDSTPTVADVLINGEYRTILVGGLGAGGRSYYALDVTDPTRPKALWEIKNTTPKFENLGLTIGKPEIGLLENGTWAVFFGSGYNNVGTTGDGRGYLFVVDAATGAWIDSIGTGVGSATTPSGMGHIRAWLDDAELDGTVRRVYGGDNLGNVWRFDVNDNVGAAGKDAQRLVVLRDTSGNPQPITSRPELGLVSGVAMVYVGTGRYLGLSDLTTSNTQSIFGIKDRLTAEDYGSARLSTTQKFVQQTLQSTSATVRTMVSVNPVNLASDAGCYVDLPTATERVTTDPQLALGTLVVNSNVLDTSNQCKVGGNSWANFLDYRTCGSVKNSPVSVSLGQALATRPSLVKLPNNKVISITRLSDNRTVSTEVPVQGPSGPTRRLSWRDLGRD